MSHHPEFSQTITGFLDCVHEFARDSLGCTCPEEVFQQVRVLQGPNVPGSADLAVIVGERLLILLAADSPEDSSERWLMELLR